MEGDRARYIFTCNRERVVTVAAPVVLRHRRSGQTYLYTTNPSTLSGMEWPWRRCAGLAAMNLVLSSDHPAFVGWGSFITAAVRGKEN